MHRPRVVVFDIGGVLVDVDYRRPCRGMFDDDAERDRFLTEVLGEGYHAERDLGIPMVETTATWCERHPGYAEQIRAFTERITEIWVGPMPGSGEVLADLKACERPVYGLSNWGHETWPYACERFAFLGRLDGVLISAEVGVMKPDQAIYESFCARFDVEPSETVFIDDIPANVDAAQQYGFHGIRFSDAHALRRELQALDLL